MFCLDADLKVYLHRKAIDFRKSINRLAVLVEQSMGNDPFAGACCSDGRHFVIYFHAVA